MLKFRVEVTDVCQDFEFMVRGFSQFRLFRSSAGLWGCEVAPCAVRSLGHRPDRLLGPSDKFAENWPYTLCIRCPSFVESYKLQRT